MKIVREFNGIKVEIELTSEEMFNAYLEKEHQFDVQDIEDELEYLESEDALVVYGLPLATVWFLKDRIAYRYRKYMENYGDWNDQRDEAIADVLREYKEEMETNV